MSSKIIELCRQMVAIDSTPAVGSYAVAGFVAKLAKDLGYRVEEQIEPLNGIEQKNIILRSEASDSLFREFDKEGKDELLLLSHLDTADPGAYGLWTETLSNPFKATLHGNKFYGLGVANSKVDFLCKLLAGHKFIDRPLKRPFAIVGTYGEQLGMMGVLKLVRAKRVRPSWALVGEATQMQAVTGGVGMTMVEVLIPFSEEEKSYHIKSNTVEAASTQSKIFHGKPGLAIQSSFEESSIVKMFDYIANLSDGVVVMSMDGGVSPNTLPGTSFLEVDLVGGFENKITKKISTILKALQNMEKKFRDRPCPGFDPQFCSLNIGKIRTYKDGIKVEGSCRILPTVTEEMAENWMLELRQVCEEVGASFQINLNRQPFLTNTDLEGPQMCQNVLRSMGLDAGFYNSSTCTEASVLSRFGINCVVIGPGQAKGNTHQPNEFVEVDQIEKALAFYENIIGNYCV